MRKLILSLIMLTTFTNVSYASFPVSDTLEVKHDTIQTEEIKQYHSSLVKMGVDLSSCKCESCRKGIEPMIDNSFLSTEKILAPRVIWLRILVVISVLSILLMIWIVRGVEKFNKSGGIGVG